MRHFRAVTTGHAVIMGRRTWESLRKPLPERQNIVVDPSPRLPRAGAEVAGSLDAALAMVRLPAPAFCIGGAELYAAVLPRADEMHVTEVAGSPVGDTFFPAWDRSDWLETERRPGAGDQHGRTGLSLRHLSPRALTRWDPRCAARGATSRCAGPRVSAIMPTFACAGTGHSPAPPRPGWRNWYTQQTQNLPAARP